MWCEFAKDLTQIQQCKEEKSKTKLKRVTFYQFIGLAELPSEDGTTEGHTLWPLAKSVASVFNLSMSNNPSTSNVVHGIGFQLVMLVIIILNQQPNFTTNFNFCTVPSFLSLGAHTPIGLGSQHFLRACFFR